VPVAYELHDRFAGPSVLERDEAPSGWPVEPAEVLLLDPEGPLAVCTLGDPALGRSLAESAPPGLAVVGPLATENIGLEKLVRNFLARASLSHLLLVGPETGGSSALGHFAGDCLVSLIRNGVDPRTMRVRGARGRRPFVKNLCPAEVEEFRRRVTLADERGALRVEHVARLARDLLAALPETRAERREEAPASSVPGSGLTRLVTATEPTFYRPDPRGYLLIFVDERVGLLLVEHYENDGRRSAVFAGKTPRALCATVISEGLVSSLEHAAYLGRELQRAAQALEERRPYVQDG
jgi:tetrahydromethanopterin S-methyltransferase subunit A